MCRLVAPAAILSIFITASPSLAAGPYDGEWVGSLVADSTAAENCGFQESPFRARIAGNRFLGRGRDASERVRPMEGEVDSDGNISFWAPWTMLWGTNKALSKVHGKFDATIKNGVLSGRFYASGCFATVLLRHGSMSTKVGEVADTERRRLADEVARLKAEAKRRALEQELARLNVEDERARQDERGTARAKEQAAARTIAESQRQETDFWQSVAASRKVEDVQRYLITYPGGTYASFARARIKQLASAEAQRQELTLWEQVKDSRDPAMVRSYIDTYPDGLFIDLARARIKSLDALALQTAALADQRNETRFWNAIRDSRNTQDFKEYLSRHPSGRYKGAAQARLKVLEKFAVVEGIDFGTYHALVIGNNDYKHLPDLKTAVGDAGAIAGALRDTYGFKVKLLTDATRRTIINALDEYVETLESQDNLLIYYAGHGWLSEDAGRGYWLPVDARKNRRSDWVSNATITDTLKSLQAKHVMVVADSCYSGTLTRGAGANLRTADYWKRMATKRTRVVLTSGGLEPVADSAGGGHSPFAKAFIDALGANEAVMDGTQLFSKMRRPVMVAAEQTPEYSDARNAGHEGGDFLFVRKR